MYFHGDIMSQEDLKEFQLTMMAPTMDWYYAPANIGGELNKDYPDAFNFTNIFYNNAKVYSGHYFKCRPIIDFVKREYDIKRALRVKANMYTNQHKPIKYISHMDYPKEVKGKVLDGVFSVNANNGGTHIGDNYYQSQENCIVLFEDQKHYAVSQTDTQVRIIINFNFEI